MLGIEDFHWQIYLGKGLHFEVETHKNTPLNLFLDLNNFLKSP